MKFAKERAQVICDQLKKAACLQQQELTDWQVKEGLFLRPEEAETDEQAWAAFDSRTMHWYGPDRHDWFRATLTVPKSFDGRPLWFRIRTQIDEWDDGKNPQFLLFLNGSVVQGLDMNHREVLVTRSAKAGETYQIDLQAYTGILHREFQLLGEMLEIDSETMGLYYDLQVPLWSLSRMEKDSQSCHAIETVLNDTVNLIDLRQAPSEAFAASVKKARAYIGQKLYTELAGHDEVIATCIGHTHIDVAWWWTVDQTREKVVRSFSTVLKLMEEYPDYKFMSSQPQLYQFLKERYPELYAKVKERVKEGRWEPEGGMWLEADCNLTSGESLVRQFLHGERFFREEFGKENHILWLPDVFGYSGALPQIAKKCGIDYFMTTKLSWNQFNKIPYDTLRWRGIDGTEILTHFITTLGIGQPTGNFFTTYNGMLHPDAVMGAWERYQNKEINNDVLIAYGYGDGGGGPTRQMLETSKRLEKGLPGVPKVRQTFAGTYFRELDERVSKNPRLPVWEGEFYFEYHRGTYTSMARNKRANRKSELLLMDLELLSVLAQRAGAAYPAQELEQMWKTVLLNQFHDILPGSAIHEVYEQTKKEYAALAAQAGNLLQERLRLLAGTGDAQVVFNTLGFVRDDVLLLPDCTAAALRLPDGTAAPVQQCADGGAAAYVTGLPAKGYVSLQPCEAAAAENPLHCTERGIETPFYTVQFGADGCLASVWDKENRREVLQAGKSANLMRVYEDKPMYYDNWDIDIFYKEKYWDVTDVTSQQWTERGPVRATLQIERRYQNSLIRQKIHFYANLRRIDFESYVDWHEHQQLLKVHFPLAIHTDEATFDIQFGNVKRKVTQNTSWEVARFESCGHKWADLSEGGYGVSLLNDCKYGHSVHDGDLALTLIKSGIEPNPTTDQEEHFFTYSLYPHAGSWQEGGTEQEAAKLNQPAYAVPGKAGLSFSLLSVDAAHVLLETVKQAEDASGTVVRVFDYKNQRGPVTVTCGKPVQSVTECNLVEKEQGAVPCGENSFTFQIAPYEIKTFKIRFAE